MISSLLLVNTQRKNTWYLYIGRVLLMIMTAPNSRARKGGKERGSMEEFKGKSRGMLSTGEYCIPASNMLHHV